MTTALSAPMAKPTRSLAESALAKTKLPPAIQQHIIGIRLELEAAYRDRFVEMTEAIKRQASAIDRIHRMVELLLEKSSPELMGTVPGLRLAAPGEEADLPSVSGVVVDPIGAGFALTQEDLARALQCGQADVSILVNELKLMDDATLAVVVRQGKSRRAINYHRRAIDRLSEIIASPPSNISSKALKAIARIQKKRAAAT
jgi:hypothetical protein